MDIKVLIALHKPYRIPEDQLYLPIQVGAFNKDGIKISSCMSVQKSDASNGDDRDLGYILRDDSGDNISAKNPFFCELTGLYYAWKNIDADAIGLVHYRRYFSCKNKKYIKKYGAFESVLSHDEACAMLTRADIVVPAKRKYYIESLYSHYDHTFDGVHLTKARVIIEDKYPDYVSYVDRAYKQTWGYMFNMAIMPRKYLDEYCAWLFDILFELENRIDVSEMDAFSQRLFGRVSEILFNAWVLKKLDDGMTLIECPVIDMEPINWPEKIMLFLQAKFIGKKYKKSM